MEVDLSSVFVHGDEMLVENPDAVTVVDASFINHRQNQVNLILLV